MRRVFALDVLACPRCGDGLRVIVTVQDPLAVQAILTHRARSGALASPGPADRLAQDVLERDLSYNADLSHSLLLPAAVQDGLHSLHSTTLCLASWRDRRPDPLEIARIIARRPA